jgi:hypothetical protein
MTPDLSLRSSYPRPGTEPRTSWKASIPQAAVLVEDSTHDGTADSIHGLKRYGNSIGDADGSGSARTPVPASHVATYSNGKTSLAPHSQDSRLERTSFGKILEESSAFPKKSQDRANGELRGRPKEDERASTVAL